MDWFARRIVSGTAHSRWRVSHRPCDESLGQEQLRVQSGSMRKHVVAPISQQAPAWDEGWLNLDNLASVEVTSKRCLRQVPDTREPVERCLVPAKKRAPLERGAHFNKRFLETSDFTSVESDNNPGSDLSLFNIAQSDHLNPAQLARDEEPALAGKNRAVPAQGSSLSTYRRLQGRG